MGERVYSLDTTIVRMSEAASLHEHSFLPQPIHLAVLRRALTPKDFDPTEEYSRLRSNLFDCIYPHTHENTLHKDYTFLRFARGKALVAGPIEFVVQNPENNYVTAFTVNPGLAVDKLPSAKRKLHGWKRHTLDYFSCLQPATVHLFSDGVYREWWNHDRDGRWIPSPFLRGYRHAFIEPTP